MAKVVLPRNANKLVGKPLGKRFFEKNGRMHTDGF
jgi:hypothetical protein